MVVPGIAAGIAGVKAVRKAVKVAKVVQDSGLLPKGTAAERAVTGAVGAGVRKVSARQITTRVSANLDVLPDSGSVVERRRKGDTVTYRVGAKRFAVAVRVKDKPRG